MKRTLFFISFIILTHIVYSQNKGCISGDCNIGFGTYVWDSGDKYIGNWENGAMHGSGVYYFAIGDKYDGNWENGKFEGYGSYYYKSGKENIGYWAANKYLGKTKPEIVYKTGCQSGDCANGYGVYVFSDGEKYEGYWKNNKRNGFGTNKWASGNSYKGEWIEDKKSGEGTFQFTNGNKYVGQWQNDKYDGEGTLFYANGTIEKGIWANSEFLGSENLSSTGCISGNCTDGFGTYSYASGGKYVGEFVDGLRSGSGTFTWEDGQWYKGNWKEGKQKGYGVFYFASGEKFEGEWDGANKNGYGTYSYNNGTTKTGIWEDDKYIGDATNKLGCISGDCKDGYGVYTWENGEKYVGNWIDGKRNGQGINYWTSGWIFDGKWENDQKNGYGLQTSPEGIVKKGFWALGEYKGEEIATSGCISGDCQNGSGTYVLTNGDKYEGRFLNGKFEGQGTYTYTSGNKYIGEFKDNKFHGQGNYTIIKTGERYVGGFAYGTYEGLGTFYFEDGRTSSGEYKNGEYVGSTRKDLALPIVSWLNPTYENMEVDNSEASVKLCIKSEEELQNVQIFVNNELQVNNAIRGFIAVSSGCDYTIERSIKLQQGDNDVKVLVTNGAGSVESDIRTINFKAISGINQKRYALVIGNGDYVGTSPLKNPVNDARDVGEELKNLGFDVMVFTNVTQNDMKEHMRTFGKKLAANKGVGLFFYAGHGMQVNGENYLIPVNARIEKEQDVELESVNLKRLMGEMEYAENDLNIVILDACRDNPFARSFRSGGNKGLASTLAPTGTFIAYATSPGSVASDGSGSNGLYTEQFLAALKQPGLRIEDVFKVVRKNVYDISQKKQVPWENSSIFGDFYFNK